jgi:hypothetical protein
MRTKRSMLAFVAISACAWAGLPAVTATAAPATPGASAIRTGSGVYEVKAGGVTLGSVTVSDDAYTTAVTAKPGGGAAAVITDFDGTEGSSLRLLSAGGVQSTVYTGRVTSVAWSGGQLAYVGDGSLRIAGQATVIGLKGPSPKLLGWAASGKAILAQTHAGGAHDANGAPSAVHVDLGTGAITPVLVSDPAKATIYRDLRLVTVKGRQLLSYVLAQHVYPCSGAATRIGLADLSGREVLSTAETTDSYRSAHFTADGRQIAAERQACVSKQEKADRAGALTRVDETNGVYVIDAASGASRRVVAGLAVNFPLAGFDGQTVRLSSSRFGDRTVATTGLTRAEALDAEVTVPGEAGIQARINPNQFIHQLWDTRNEFHGGSACGPTSAVMDLAGYQIANHWGVQVSSPSSHWSPWGLYITNTFTNAGNTFNRSQPDAAGRGAWTGAYGWMVLNYTVGTYWSEMTSFLQRNGAYVRAGMYDANWIRARINEGYMVVVSGNFVYGAYGHIGLITGYTDDGRFYVNDPYGNGTDASFDGRNSVYTWDYIRPKNFWAA